MKLKSAGKRLCQTVIIIISLSLLITRTEAQAIGHLGVNTEPIPLVQAKRPQRKLVSRSLLAKRPDPSSKDLRADIAELPESSGKSADVKSNTSGTVLVAVTPPTSTPKTPSSNSTNTTASTTSSKTVLSPFEESLVKAETLLEKGESRVAVEAFRSALKLKPESIDAQLGLAESLFDIKDFANAEIEYQKAISLNQNSIEALRGRADTLYELNKYEDAVTEYEAALKA